MKTVFKYFFFFTGLLIIILALLFFLYKGSIVNNLKDKTRSVDSKWSDLYQMSSNRTIILNELTSHLQNTGLAFDSLKISLKNNLSNRSRHQSECSLNFVDQEYDVNKYYLEFLKTYKKDSVPGWKEINYLIQKLKINDEKINKIVDDYNNTTLDLNTYISIFPNFYFAKRYSFYKKKFFSIKYGVENEDPVARSKELPQWAKDADTL
jgi:hypothetical protein